MSEPGTDYLRAVVREILTEELYSLKNETTTLKSREEVVSITNNSELSAFVQHLLTIGQDSSLRADILSGKHVFRLAPTQIMPGQTPSADVYQPGSAVSQKASPVKFDSGLVTEKQVANLPHDIVTLSIGETVKFTPLARDELRRRGIQPERSKS